MRSREDAAWTSGPSRSGTLLSSSPMATTKEKKPPKPRKAKPKNSCFPSCFGFGGSASNPEKAAPNTNSRKKRSPWFSWPSFRARKLGSKTVPVDVAVVEKATRGAEIAEIGEVTKGVSDKTAGKRQIRGGAPERKLCRDVREAVTVGEKDDLEKSRKSNKFGSGKLQRTEPHASIPAVESRTPTTISADDDLCPTAARKAGTRLSSPEAKPSRSLSTSSSFPPPGRWKSVQTASISRLFGRKTDRGDDPLAGKFDPTVGMTILIVTLAILLLWGRFCAVLCTSAWFYFIPRLRKAGKSEEVAGKQMGAGKPDVESREYKKKVVLEGLLERNHRNSLAGPL